MEGTLVLPGEGDTGALTIRSDPMRKLVIFSGAFALAAAVYVYLVRDARALWLAGAFLALSLLGRWRNWRRLAVAGLGFAVGILWCFAYQSVRYGLEAYYGTEETVTLRLDDRPVQTQYGARVAGELVLDGRNYLAVLYDDGELLELAPEPGEFVTCLAQIEPAGLSVRDGENLYLRSQGIELQLKARSELTVTPGRPNLSAAIRMWLQDRIHSLYEGETAGLVRALLTGDRSELSYNVQNRLSVAGLSHAVAVSGMHVSFLLMMAACLCGGSPRMLAVVGIPLVVLFALVTGASPSVCRAAVMQVLILAAPLIRRESDGPTNLAAAALILLMENPWTVASISFQLSFAAVAGLLLLSGPIQQKLLSMKRKPGRVYRFVVSGISATLSATAATLPLTVYYFGLLSIAAPLTNLLSLWAVTVVFMLGLLSCCLGPVGVVLAWVVDLLSRYVLTLCGVVSSVPFAAAYPQNVPLLIWAILAYGVALTALLTKRKLPVLPLLSGLTAGFLACILWGNWNFFREEWQFAALDVGQGQCLVFRSEEYVAVIDCGGPDPEEAGETAARYLHSAGVTAIDALILTHYDEDHSGGALQLLDRVRVDSVFLPELQDKSGIRAALEAAESRVFLVDDRVQIAFPGGEIWLYPPVLKENDNNGGVCVLATAAEYDILITGDMDRFGEMRLMSVYDLPDVDLLVAGHHGAADSVCPLLLDTVRPETVVISVGENQYGHPAGETLDRIANTGAAILRTDEMGTVTMTSEERR